MNGRNVLSLSAIMSSQDAGRSGFLGLSASSLHRLLLVIPALCALAYPSLLSLLSAGLVLVHGSASPDGVIVWVTVIASLTLALAVMLVSFVFGRALGSPHAGSPEGGHARSIAHLAFATPSLYVGFANVAGVLRTPSAVPIAWSIFWALVAMIVLLARAPGHHRQLLPYARRTSPTGPCPWRFRLRDPAAVRWASHWESFGRLLERISTHGIMNAVRRVYRDDVVQPVLLALIGFQILSGIALVRSEMRMRSDFLGTVQTMFGAYVGVYFLAHMTAVFAARYADMTRIGLVDPPAISMLVVSPISA